MTNVPNYDRFDRLHALMSTEVSSYWERFTGFATLHGGLFVVASVKQTWWGSLAIVLLGVILAAIWWTIQTKSLKFVDRWKPAFHDERKLVGLEYAGVPANRRYSPTDIGTYVPLGVLLIWLILLGSLFYSG